MDFFALSRFLFTERLHYTRMVLTFILKGPLQKNGHMVEKLRLLICTQNHPLQYQRLQNILKQTLTTLLQTWLLVRSAHTIAHSAHFIFFFIFIYADITV